MGHLKRTNKRNNGDETMKFKPGDKVRILDLAHLNEKYRNSIAEFCTYNICHNRDGNFLSTVKFENNSSETYAAFFENEIEKAGE